MNTEETPSMTHTDAPTSEPNTPEENPTGQDAGPARTAWWRNPRIVAPVVALAVMVAAGGAWVGVEAYRTSRAHAAWETATTRASDAREALVKAVEQARPVIEAAEARDVDAGELAALVEEATKTTPTRAGQEPSGRAELTHATEELTSTAAQITALVGRLTNATGKVEDTLITSAESKLAEAVDAAASVLVRVDETIEDARGKVADDNTLTTARAEADALTVLILSSHQGEEFRKLYTITDEPQSGTQSGAQSGDAATQSGAGRPEWEVIEAETEAITAQYAKLDEALKAINTSIGEKNKANAEAEAAKAANQAGGNTGSYTGGGNAGSGYSAPHNSGGGGYTAPAPSNGGRGGGAAPTGGGNGGGSAPAGGGGGFDWGDEWVPSDGGDEFGNTWDHW